MADQQVPQQPEDAPKSVIILGGGIVGCATAHYLRQISGPEELQIVVIDKVGIAAAASGRAGGFLARDWHSGAVAPLSAQSFALHAELAKTFGAETIGYRPCRAIQPTCRGGKTQKRAGKAAWYDGCAGCAPEIAARDTAAQVIPTKLTDALFVSSAAELIIGHAASVKDGMVTVETAEGSAEYSCDALVLACGPWTSTVARELNIPMRAHVLGLKAYSVLMKPKPTKEVDDSCLFMDWQGDPFAGEFELYPRLDGVYVCGCGERPRMVGEEPADVAISDKAKACLIASAASVSSALDGAAILRETACYLPVTNTGDIVAGKLAESHGGIAHGVFVATGHSCWGILNGPATGQGLAELILRGGGPAARLIAPFAPR